MSHLVSTATLREMSARERNAMFRLRHETFKVRLGWEVESTQEGYEIDQFDSAEEASYILAKSAGDTVEGCWRLLPTIGPNMLRDLEVFHPLLDGAQPPAATDVWEISRFAQAQSSQEGELGEKQQASFGPLSLSLMLEAARFARARGIRRYVYVTTTAMERMLKRQGLHIHRLGTPKKIGGVLTVACYMEVDEINFAALARN